jgi:hypothetical protein
VARPRECNRTGGWGRGRRRPAGCGLTR